MAIRVGYKQVISTTLSPSTNWQAIAHLIGEGGEGLVPDRATIIAQTGDSPVYISSGTGADPAWTIDNIYVKYEGTLDPCSVLIFVEYFHSIGGYDRTIAGDYGKIVIGLAQFPAGQLGARVRLFYDTAYNQLREDTDENGTGFWVPIRKTPGINIQEPFVNPFINLPVALVLGKNPWLYTVVGTGIAAAINAIGGGLRFAAPANVDAVKLMYGSSGAFTLALNINPTFHFQMRLNNLHAQYVADFGLEDATTNSHIKLRYAGGVLNYSVDNGSGVPNLTVLAGAVLDTAWHNYTFRFEFEPGSIVSGTRCRITQDGVLLATITLTGTAKYPAVATLLNLFMRVLNAGGGTGTFNTDFRHIYMAANDPS